MERVAYLMSWEPSWYWLLEKALWVAKFVGWVPEAVVLHPDDVAVLKAERPMVDGRAARMTVHEDVGHPRGLILFLRAQPGGVDRPVPRADERVIIEESSP